MISEDEILKMIKWIVLEKEPSAKIYLYGSRAKGTSKPDSDWDLLILLNKDKITWDIKKNITYLLYDLEFETGEVISPMIYSAGEWDFKYKITPFYLNIMREGRVL